MTKAEKNTILMMRKQNKSYKYIADVTGISINGNDRSNKIKLSFHKCYWEVFDPFEQDEPVCCDLIDDLTDIVNDLQYGILEYETGKIGNAVFEWKLSFDSHWGQHLVDALRVLHAIRTR